MAKLPLRLLNKRESLTADDYKKIHAHPIFSYKMIKDSSIIKDSVKVAVLEHHGRIDGTGYPKRLKTKPMNLFSKIIAVADVFHDDFGKFDIAVVKTLLSSFANFSIGSRVKLNNGFIAEIIFIDAGSQTRPVIKVMDSEQIINLGINRELYIEEIL